MQFIHEIISVNARQYPDKAAFVYEERETTYRALKQRVDRLTNGLSDLGVKKGDRIAILSKNRPEYFETYCTGKNGFVIVPLNHRSGGKELVFLINNSGAETLIIEQDFLETIEQIKGDIHSVRNYICIGHHPGYLDYEQIIENASPEVKPVELEEDDLWCIFYTSGTTGLPKGAMLTHKGLLKTGSVASREFKLLTEDVAIHVMPFFHVGGMWYFCFPCFATGITNIVLSQFRPGDFLRCVDKHKVTRTHLVPTMIVALLEELRVGKYDVSSLSSILYAASPMPVETLKNAMNAFPKCRFLQSYGSTEVTGTTLTEEDHEYGMSEKEDLLFSCGRPWPDTEIKIVREDGTKAQSGEIGEIALKNERMMVGYWGNREGTTETIKNGWLFTGDMGKLDRDGYLYISDRKKDMVISGGENVYPAEVEDVLTRHPAVLEAAVIGVPDKKWIEAVKAIIILREGMQATEEEIIDFCKSRIAGYKCPKSVDFVTELPKSPAGKILKRVLREERGYQVFA